MHCSHYKKTRMLENIFLKIYKYMYDYIKTMDSIYCVLTPVSWVRTVNRFIFYYKHCIKLSYANFPLLLALINIKLQMYQQNYVLKVRNLNRDIFEL